MSRPKWPRSVWRFWTRSATRATAWAARKFSHSTWSTFTCAESKTAAALTFTGKFFRTYFEQELRGSLDRNECRYPEDLRVDVHVTRELPAPAELWVWVEAESQERPAAAPRRTAKLIVVEGQANAEEIALS